MTETSEPLLRIESLHKRFEENIVLSGASLHVARGSLVTVLGRSGTGKSVLLKCLAGIITPDEGRIQFDGKDLDDSTRADFRRRCSFLFQNNALFDSLTALENVALPLEQTTDLSDAEIRRRSLDALQQLELDTYHNRHPSQLSGGMQKRLALARAIVTKPELVLFDEPTAGLDPIRRNAVFTMILKYQRQFHFTAVVVTHDLDEALIASDRVALLDSGQIPFEGPPSAFTVSTHPIVCSFRDSTQALKQSVTSIRSEMSAITRRTES